MGTLQVGLEATALAVTEKLSKKQWGRFPSLVKQIVENADAGTRGQCCRESIIQELLMKHQEIAAKLCIGSGPVPWMRRPSKRYLGILTSM